MIKRKWYYAFVASLYRQFSLSGDASLNDFSWHFTKDLILKPDMEKVINKDFTICGFLHKDEVNYWVIKNGCQASCQDIADNLVDYYDNIMAIIEEEKAKVKDALIQE